MSDTPGDSAIPAASLIDNDAFRDVCQSYAALFGAGIKLVSARGDVLVDIAGRNGEHCGLLNGVPATHTMCTQLLSHIQTMPVSAEPAPVSIDCFSGLRYKALPVIHDGEVVVRIILGPYVPATYDGPPAALRAHAPALDLERLQAHGQVIPRLPDDMPEKILAHLRQVLDALMRTNYKAAVIRRMHVASMSGAFADLERTEDASPEGREQDLQQLKRNFVSMVSHELRTPLASVIGYAEMLLEGLAGELNEEQRLYIGTILKKGETLLYLINQILDLVRAAASESTIRREPTEMRRLLLLSLQDVETLSNQRDVHFETEIDAHVTPISVDPDKIRRIMVNLLTNAIKFTPPGGTVRLHVDVVTEPPEQNKYLRIRVSDTGIGIAKDNLERIFETFYQVDNTATREFGGTGLGLSIVRSFAQAHRGRVDVESVEGAGSTFSVRLPYSVAPQAG